MVIINKKRLYIIFSCLIISFLFCEFKNANITNEMSIPTVALPASSKVIVLDAGHGNPDGGGTSNNGVSESDINLQITKKVQSLLEQSRCNCHINTLRRKRNL